MSARDRVWLLVCAPAVLSACQLLNLKGKSSDAGKVSDAGDASPSVTLDGSVAESKPVTAPSVRCDNPRHVVFEDNGKRFCALACRGPKFSVDCSEGETCSGTATLLEDERPNIQKYYCIKEKTLRSDGGVTDATVSDAAPIGALASDAAASSDGEAGPAGRSTSDYLDAAAQLQENSRDAASYPRLLRNLKLRKPK